MHKIMHMLMSNAKQTLISGEKLQSSSSELSVFCDQTKLSASAATPETSATNAKPAKTKNF